MKLNITIRLSVEGLSENVKIHIKSELKTQNVKIRYVIVNTTRLQNGLPTRICDYPGREDRDPPHTDLPCATRGRCYH